jgi:serine/threonine protein kinase
MISDQGVLKLGDFGLARPIATPDAPLSPNRVTRWYRSPELLFGADKYGFAVDMWSVCTRNPPCVIYCKETLMRSYWG